MTIADLLEGRLCLPICRLNRASNFHVRSAQTTRRWEHRLLENYHKKADASRDTQTFTRSRRAADRHKEQPAA